MEREHTAFVKQLGTVTYRLVRVSRSFFSKTRDVLEAVKQIHNEFAC
jgi:hypothetical protein